MNHNFAAVTIVTGYHKARFAGVDDTANAFIAGKVDTSDTPSKPLAVTRAIKKTCHHRYYFPIASIQYSK
jgi:hypothetical protein